MTTPAAAREASDRVLQSRVADEALLAAFFDSVSPADLEGLSPTEVLELMHARGLLTAYQATRLAAGRGDGLRVGVYVVLDYLGRGGAGQVFLAEHALLGKRVAIKVLSGALDVDPAARGRFVREARAAAAVDHPSVVHVYDVDVDNDPAFLVMEYVDGVSLQAAVAGRGAFSPAEAAAVGAQVGRGLQPAADVGMVHRDIKPANILIDRKGAVKILDLGIARFADESHSRPSSPSEILGTLDYLAPEQAVDSSTVDARADIYSLGATLYFLLAGHPPFPGDDASRKIAHKQSADPTPLHELRPDVPVELSAVIARLLARDPADRPQSPSEAAALLDPWATPDDDFPARLFRSQRPSTHADEDRPTDHLGPPAAPVALANPAEPVTGTVAVSPVVEPDPVSAPPTPSSSRVLGWVAGLAIATGVIALVIRSAWFGGR